MKTCWILALFCFSLPAFGLSRGMEKAVVHSMRKVPCIDIPETARVDLHSNLVANPPDIGGECVEYELRTEKVSYVVRPRRRILLLLGGDVSIRFATNELLLRTADLTKDVRCDVVSMSLRTAAETPERRRDRRAPARCYEDGHEIPCPDY